MGRTKRNKHKSQPSTPRQSPVGDIHSDRKRILIYQVDLHGLTWEEAQIKLRAAPREALHKGSRLLKIIHGYGKSTGSNVLQVAVRGWLARNPFPFRAAIPGEAYTLSDPTTTELRAEIGDFPDNDLNATNAGMTLVWLK
jgi:dsDNA-specific endonuclease/ATPase MutS2